MDRSEQEIIILMDGKQVAVLIALFAAAAMLLNHHSTSTVSQFDQWKATHGISYSSQFENAYRERIFLQNLAEIEAHNARKDQTYTMGINQFTAMTQEEFEEAYLGLIAPESNQNVEINQEYTVAGDIDWNSQGYVTPVKNQGQCGSCWAFSTTGGLEWLSKSQGNLQSFSEQQLVDCSSSYGNQGCNGGLMTSAFKYVRDKGIVHEDEYPYKAVKQACKQDSGPYKIGGYKEIRDCNTLSSTISNRAISVAVDATNWSRYGGGVFSNCATRLNHGVTLIGVNSGNWVIKNSWGTTWGEKGTIRLASGNTCGVCNMASYPTA